MRMIHQPFSQNQPALSDKEDGRSRNWLREFPNYTVSFINSALSVSSKVHASWVLLNEVSVNLYSCFPLWIDTFSDSLNKARKSLQTPLFCIWDHLAQKVFVFDPTDQI